MLREAGLVLDEGELGAALHFMHSLGVILHFPHGSLSQTVFLHPQWVACMIRVIIRHDLDKVCKLKLSLNV
jgi:hypothetical protein